jgi:hypothetical protein
VDTKFYAGISLQQKRGYFPVLLVVMLLLTAAQAALQSQKTAVLTVSALETPNSIQVYWDPNCENLVKSLDWGNIFAGRTQNIDLFLRNEGDELVSLDLTAENWAPATAEQNMTLSWNYDGYPIYKDQVRNVQLALSVSPEVQGLSTFSFDIVIGSEERDLSLGEVTKEKMLEAPANTVYFIYADPSHLSGAEAAYDGTSGEIIRSLCTNCQCYGFNTRPDWLLPSGEANTTTIKDSTVVLFGGKYANKAVNYYETVKEITPVTFSGNESCVVFENRTGTTIGCLSNSVFESSKYSEDMFAMMTFYDGSNTFVVMYGVSWKGTWAAGVYFSEVISKNLSEYTKDCYIFHWVDQNEMDGIPQSHEIYQES